jgi:hypothetical protein
MKYVANSCLAPVGCQPKRVDKMKELIEYVNKKCQFELIDNRIILTIPISFIDENIVIEMENKYLKKINELRDMLISVEQKNIELCDWKTEMENKYKKLKVVCSDLSDSCTSLHNWRTKTIGKYEEIKNVHTELNGRNITLEKKINELWNEHLKLNKNIEKKFYESTKKCENNYRSLYSYFHEISKINEDTNSNIIVKKIKKNKKIDQKIINLQIVSQNSCRCDDPEFLAQFVQYIKQNWPLRDCLGRGQSEEQWVEYYRTEYAPKSNSDFVAGIMMRFNEGQLFNAFSMLGFEIVDMTGVIMGQNGGCSYDLDIQLKKSEKKIQSMYFCTFGDASIKMFKKNKVYVKHGAQGGSLLLYDCLVVRYQE